MKAAKLAQLSLPVLLATILLAAMTSLAQGQSRVSFERLHEAVPTSIGNELVVADFDGNGLDDVLLEGDDLTQPSGSTLHLLLNRDGGLFESSWISLPQGFRLDRIDTADVNGDTHVDIVGRNSIWLNDGTGRAFSAISPLPAQGQSEGVVVGDLDGDGDNDIYRLTPPQPLGPTDTLWLNDGNATFTDGSSGLPPNTRSIEIARLADLDGDGDLDVVRDVASQSRLGVLLNDGNAIFTVAPNTAALSGSAGSIQFADLEADGDLDIVVQRPIFALPGPPQFYLNDGNAGFTNAGQLLTVPTRRMQLIQADGDALVDILVEEIDNQILTHWNLYHNRGGLLFEASTLELPAAGVLSGERVTAPLDADGDGDLDVFLAMDSTRNALWLSDGAGEFLDAANVTPEGLIYRDEVALGDLDGDGDVDAAVAQEGSLVVLENDGTGRFTRRPDSPPTIPSRRVLLFDMDGDGDLDIHCGRIQPGSAPNKSSLLENDGSGSFSDASSQLPDRPALTWQAAGDLDGDGDADLLLIEENQLSSFPVLRLLVNDGDGVFSDATTTLPAMTFPGSPALGDVDGDGDLDLFVPTPNTFFQPHQLFVNDGFGSFSVTPQPAFAAAPSAEFAALFDVDADGDADLALASGSDLLLYENDGSGTFATTANSYPNADDLAQLKALDANDDGFEDLVDGANHLWLADGLGGLVDASGELERIGAPTRVAVFDVDLDGDTDIWQANPSGLYVNTLTQLAWRELPSIGRELVLDVYGTPNGSWILFNSPGTGFQAFSFGIARLDLTRIAASGSGLLDANGRASVLFQVPNNLALVDLEVFWQALLGSPKRVTNLESSVLTGF